MVVGIAVHMCARWHGGPAGCEAECEDDEQCLCECQGGTWELGIETEGWCNSLSPIVISLNKKATYQLTSPQNGVLFDMDGDGLPQKISWAHKNSDVGFLALDRDGDGQITTGRELFGSHTFPKVLNGFIALRMAAMATNGGIKRGAVTADDPVFAKLLFWTDTNQNGISEAWELRPISEVVSAIGLAYEPSQYRDPHGNRFLYRGWAHLRTAPGKNSPKTAEEDKERTIKIWDVVFTAAK